MNKTHKKRLAKFREQQTLANKEKKTHGKLNCKHDNGFKWLQYIISI